MVESQYVTIVSAEAQEGVNVDLRVLDSVVRPDGQLDPRYRGAGTKRWLSRSATEELRQALLPLIGAAEQTDASAIKRAVELIDFGLSTGTGIAVVLSS